VNPPPGEPDWGTRWIVVTRAAVLPMTLFAGLVAGLLAVRATGFRWADLVLAIVGVTRPSGSTSRATPARSTRRIRRSRGW